MAMKHICALILLAAIGTSVGCVERELTLKTEPAGAVAYVSGVEVGRTPVTIEFTWYGDYDVVFRKEGYDTLKTNVKLDPPWYEWPVIDLFSQIAPWTYHDRREPPAFALQAQVVPEDETLIRRAKDMRTETIAAEEELAD